MKSGLRPDQRLATIESGTEEHFATLQRPVVPAGEKSIFLPKLELKLCQTGGDIAHRQIGHSAL